jgi:hypothetical protein
MPMRLEYTKAMPCKDIDRYLNKQVRDFVWVARHRTKRNMTLQEYFGIDAENNVTASQSIKEAPAAVVIRLQDPNAPPKTRRYLPHWA